MTTHQRIFNKLDLINDKIVDTLNLIDINDDELRKKVIELMLANAEVINLLSKRHPEINQYLEVSLDPH